MSDLTPAMVRDYLQVTGNSGQWSDGLIGSNITAARSTLQRMTNRQFEPQGSNTAVTKTFSTRGRTYVTIPDLQSASSVTLHDTTLGTDQYHLIPDRMNTGVYTAVQIPGNRDYGDYRSHSDWFDRNLDSWWWRGRLHDRPNDLEIAGQWGHSPYPDDFLLAWKVMAAYLTIRTDALLSGAVNRLNEGVIFDLSRLPIEVQNFVTEWKNEDHY